MYIAFYVVLSQGTEVVPAHSTYVGQRQSVRNKVAIDYRGEHSSRWILGCITAAKPPCTCTVTTTTAKSTATSTTTTTTTTQYKLQYAH